MLKAFQAFRAAQPIKAKDLCIEVSIFGSMSMLSYYALSRRLPELSEAEQQIVADNLLIGSDRTEIKLLDHELKNYPKPS